MEKTKKGLIYANEDFYVNAHLGKICNNVKGMLNSLEYLVHKDVEIVAKTTSVLKTFKEINKNKIDILYVPNLEHLFHGDLFFYSSDLQMNIFVEDAHKEGHRYSSSSAFVNISAFKKDYFMLLQIYRASIKSTLNSLIYGNYFKDNPMEVDTNDTSFSIAAG